MRGVEEDRVAQQHRRGVDEEALLADGARKPREDRLEAQGLELDVHLVLVGDREEDGRRLEGRPLRSPDQGLVAHDRAVRQVAHGLKGRPELPAADDQLQTCEELDLLVGLALRDDLDGFLERAHDVARGPHAGIVGRRQARDEDVDEIGGRSLERLPEPPDDARTKSRRFFVEIDGRPAAARRRQAVEDEEAVGAGKADRVDVGREPRRAHVVLQALGQPREDPVVVLPAEELLEAEEFADLEVDDAEVVDPLVGALGRLERVNRKVRDPVVDDSLAAQLVEPLGRGHGRLRKRAVDDVGFGAFGPHPSSMA